MVPITPKVREYLEKNIAEDIPWQYDSEYVFAKERALYWKNKVVHLETTLRTKCNHIKKEVKTTHYDGSYLDKAYTEYVVVCMKCKARLFEDYEVHSWYG